MNLLILIHSLQHNIRSLESDIVYLKVQAEQGLVGTGAPASREAALKECVLARDEVLNKIRNLGSC